MFSYDLGLRFFVVVELVNWTQFSTEHRGKGWKKLFCEWDPDSGEYFPHFLQSIFLNFRIFLTFLFSPPTNFFETVSLIFEVIFLTFWKVLPMKYFSNFLFS